MRNWWIVKESLRVASRLKWVLTDVPFSTYQHCGQSEQFTGLVPANVSGVRRRADFWRDAEIDVVDRRRTGLYPWRPGRKDVSRRTQSRAVDAVRVESRRRDGARALRSVRGRCQSPAESAGRNKRGRTNVAACWISRIVRVHPTVTTGRSVSTSLSGRHPVRSHAPTFPKMTSGAVRRPSASCQVRGK